MSLSLSLCLVHVEIKTAASYNGGIIPSRLVWMEEDTELHGVLTSDAGELSVKLF